MLNEKKKKILSSLFFVDIINLWDFGDFFLFLRFKLSFIKWD